MTGRACKSWKREVAAGCLAFVAAMVVWLFALDDVAKIAVLSGVVTGLGGTVVVMALAVFGLHHLRPPGDRG